MSSPCCLHLTFSLPVHNMKHHLDSTTFSKTTLYTENIFQKLHGRKTNAKEPLSHVNYERGGNLRTNTPSGYDTKELATKELATKELAIKELATSSGSSLGDIYQLYDVQRQFGEQGQQAPIIEEVKEFGQIEAQSLLDQEIAEMSPVE